MAVGYLHIPRSILYGWRPASKGWAEDLRPFLVVRSPSASRLPLLRAGWRAGI